MILAGEGAMAFARTMGAAETEELVTLEALESMSIHRLCLAASRLLLQSSFVSLEPQKLCVFADFTSELQRLPKWLFAHLPDTWNI